MACDPSKAQDNRRRQFNKIKILSMISDDIASFAAQKGYSDIFDYLDLTCGAVPEGEYEQVIDSEAPHQFLELYMHMAEDRFAQSVTQTLKLNEEFLPAIKQYLFNAGTQIKGDTEVKTVQDAFDIINDWVLDGMPCDQTKKDIVKTEGTITWCKACDTHQEFWVKAGSSLDTYYSLLQSFVSGLINDSLIKFEIKDNSSFSLIKQ